jgi:hypothetical protein
MAMAGLSHIRRIGPVAAVGSDCRQALREQLCCASDERLVLIAFGGIDMQLPIAEWPPVAGVRWLVPQAWQLACPNASDFDPLERPFTDILRSVDAVIAKPGYGTFTEAACNRTPVLYMRRQDWPEQDCLIEAGCKHMHNAGKSARQTCSQVISMGHWPPCGSKSRHQRQSRRAPTKRQQPCCRG